jgi:hypothetical protein
MRLKRFVIGALVAGSLLGGAVGVSADVGVNPGSPQSANSGNCIAVYSSDAIHNGQAPTLGANAAHGARGDEIKADQATCA